MAPDALTAPRILDTAEEVLRRFGPEKATVVDVARALGVSHGAVYRHFASKAALREAVAARWLARLSDPLAALAEGKGPAPERLRRWFEALIGAKRRKVLEDPELFETYSRLVAESGAVVHAHVSHLTVQLERIVADGAARGEFRVEDPAAAARAVFSATSRFHNPAHAGEWSQPGIDQDFEGVFALVLGGLGAAPRARTAARIPARVQRTAASRRK